jgi:hypothetical protein
MRRLVLGPLDSWHKEIAVFNADVQANPTTVWGGAVQRFANWNDALERRYNGELKASFATLTPTQQSVVAQAVKETFG